jgi:hypothetical protein
MGISSSNPKKPPQLQMEFPVLCSGGKNMIQCLKWAIQWFRIANRTKK